jgi:hypothetical protein
MEAGLARSGDPDKVTKAGGIHSGVGKAHRELQLC